MAHKARKLEVLKEKKWFPIALVAMVILGLFYVERGRILDVLRTQTAPALPDAIDYQGDQFAESKPGTTKPAQSPATHTTIVAEINLAVPFTVQAPTTDWNQPYQDACEEASVLMVKEYYAKGPRLIDPDVATKEILAMVAFEDQLFGYNIDTTVAETALFAEEMYGLQAEILENPTVEQLKVRLDKGQPIIFPAAGQVLKNPYFTPPGPTYHMAVIRGYTKNNLFIVNDPGTKRGNAYVYSFDTLMSAIHDWNAGADILEGKKVVLILHPKK
ncbi:hypothetical protein A3C09_01415 [Candidatus Uhrbacteria bacterium RIFCSPHIGHO2_02_FULL_47_44]|uniref:Peptidase C39-like domain-containing protein n=1 Tax=Candidatus Uhrbacteria bacterium RIFCSPLOWO2_02_FULL_48_18 TaxID=1802408 RepID=A0A1F7VA29_9BACT|nr:MAG: hypothetical protein A2839_02295 [Candidatus Uhrbacteria bacterium RIFCSPHIGHO2_01_FULL_47_10]OGL69824.1 MAG: hypothetical protein A3C09_01415 [Candidatus Uhrbacteria bacterium RIFCSPHIGHO2_02_FULL_47_44]OGL77444.1 MAG: hypothetical protein A3E97_00470 [Candidatus Uhrbacteria bacterium RIFCSPHIGHO2_12_FULL_47_12]OGL81805.1 MAG: hypothetical protein A3B20_01780 [Candidatus Uhrbacteria bacterium RIFCSPLOWO2_01_FULL_47_17]OGL86968.1 MAG: hypothetical protein A3I41_03370 [Candidatus Uhrbact